MTFRNHCKCLAQLSLQRGHSFEYTPVTKIGSFVSISTHAARNKTFENLFMVSFECTVRWKKTQNRTRMANAMLGLETFNYLAIFTIISRYAARIIQQYLSVSVRFYLDPSCAMQFSYNITLKTHQFNSNYCSNNELLFQEAMNTHCQQQQQKAFNA